MCINNVFFCLINLYKKQQNKRLKKNKTNIRKNVFFIENLAFKNICVYKTSKHFLFDIVRTCLPYDRSKYM